MNEMEFMRGLLEQAPGRACLTCSFQAEDMVVLHMLRQIDPDVPVLFLDTGYHFPDLLRYRDRMVESWRINLVNVASPVPREQQERRLGPLYKTDPAACCRLRKVEPLLRALEDYAVWFTGLRREQSPTRAGLAVVDNVTLPSGHGIWKVSPLAVWRWNEVWSYLRVNEIPYAPLYDEGYTSIGCAPCTTPPTDAENARSGRWGGVKLECGIHTFAGGNLNQEH
jgi:phosphoadenosine phosphosulfate reductase